VQSLSGSSYFITFIDDFSRFVVVKLIRTKDQALPMFIKLVMADWWLYNFDISLVQFEMSQINV
jgi:hypothetical protein